MQNGAIFFQEELYLNSETNFFSLLVFTGSQDPKNWRRARHHDATFLMKTKRHKEEDDNLFFPFAWLVASQKETATIDFSFWGFSWNLVRDPLQGKPEFRT